MSLWEGLLLGPQYSTIILLFSWPILELTVQRRPKLILWPRDYWSNVFLGAMAPHLRPGDHIRQPPPLARWFTGLTWKQKGKVALWTWTALTMAAEVVVLLTCAYR